MGGQRSSLVGVPLRDVLSWQRSVNDLARIVRHHHFEDDGCAEPSRPVLHLGGAALFEPGEMESQQDSYRVGCARLGVDARDEGWALWCTWDDQERAHTMVTTALETTRGLLDNWAQGRDVHPAQPRRSQIRAVIRGMGRADHPVAQSRQHERAERMLSTATASARSMTGESRSDRMSR